MTTDPNLRTFIVTMNAKTVNGGGYTAGHLADVIIDERAFAGVDVAETDAATGVADEYGTRLTSGGYQTWNTEPRILERYPLAERIELERRHGKVWRRRIIVVEDWAELPAGAEG